MTDRVVEYIAIGAEVYAVTESGHEQFVARCEEGDDRAERLAANLNAKLIEQEGES